MSSFVVCPCGKAIGCRSIVLFGDLREHDCLGCVWKDNDQCTENQAPSSVQNALCNDCIRVKITKGDTT